MSGAEEKCLFCFIRRANRGINVNYIKATLAAYLDPEREQQYTISEIAKTHIKTILEEISADGGVTKQKCTLWLLLAVLDKDNAHHADQKKKCPACLKPPAKKKKTCPSSAAKEKKPSSSSLSAPTQSRWTAINWDSPLFPSEPFLGEEVPPLLLEENIMVAPAAAAAVTDDNFMTMLSDLNAFLASDHMCHLQQEKPPLQ